MQSQMKRPWTLFHTQIDATQPGKGAVASIGHPTVDSLTLRPWSAVLLLWGPAMLGEGQSIAVAQQRIALPFGDWLRRSSADSSAFATTAVLRTGAIV